MLQILNSNTRNCFLYVFILFSLNTSAQSNFNLRFFIDGKRFNNTFYSITTKYDIQQCGEIKSTCFDEPNFNCGSIIYKTCETQELNRINIPNTASKWFPYFSKSVRASIKRDEDQLVITPWSGATNTGLFGNANGTTSYYYDINWTNGRFRIPFRYNYLGANVLPFRVRFKDGTLDKDFLNFNASYLWTYGQLTIRQNPDYESYFWNIGIGPFLGLTDISIEKNEAKDSENHLGITYGLNSMFTFHKLNLSVGIGMEHDTFTPNWKSQGMYIGFGIGFSLIETITPEIKEVDSKLKTTCCCNSN